MHLPYDLILILRSTTSCLSIVGPEVDNRSTKAYTVKDTRMCHMSGNWWALTTRETENLTLIRFKLTCTGATWLIIEETWFCDLQKCQSAKTVESAHSSVVYSYCIAQQKETKLITDCNRKGHTHLQWSQKNINYSAVEMNWDPAIYCGSRWAVVSCETK